MREKLDARHKAFLYTVLWTLAIWKTLGPRLSVHAVALQRTWLVHCEATL